MTLYALKDEMSFTIPCNGDNWSFLCWIFFSFFTRCAFWALIIIWFRLPGIKWSAKWFWSLEIRHSLWYGNNFCKIYLFYWSTFKAFEPWLTRFMKWLILIPRCHFNKLHLIQSKQGHIISLLVLIRTAHKSLKFLLELRARRYRISIRCSSPARLLRHKSCDK